MLVYQRVVYNYMGTALRGAWCFFFGSLGALPHVTAHAALHACFFHLSKTTSIMEQFQCNMNMNVNIPPHPMINVTSSAEHEHER